MRWYFEKYAYFLFAKFNKSLYCRFRLLRLSDRPQNRREEGGDPICESSVPSLTKEGPHASEDVVKLLEIGMQTNLLS
jgi:hypothetical protein